MHAMRIAVLKCYDYLEEDIRDELDAMGVTDIDDYRLSQFVDAL